MSLTTLCIMRPLTTFARMLALYSGATSLVVSTAAAQIRPQVSDSLVFKGARPSVQRLPVRGRAAPPPPNATLPVPPPPPKAAVGIFGSEIAVGPVVSIAPLTIVDLSAQCPSGKVAISAGMDLGASGDAVYGGELRGTSISSERLVRARVRNANVFATVTGRAMAVCITPIAGMRTIMFGAMQMGARDPAHRADQGCAANERLIGGGVMGSDLTQIAVNAPQGSTPQAVTWQEVVAPQNTVVIPGVGFNAEARAICAPASGVDGWSFVETAEVSLAARGVTTLSINCPAGAALLAAGVAQQSSNYIDMLANDLTLANGSATAQVVNRNIIGGGVPVRARLAGLCARKQ
jgi:hypothetical protein